MSCLWAKGQPLQLKTHVSVSLHFWTLVRTLSLHTSRQIRITGCKVSVLSRRYISLDRDGAEGNTTNSCGYFHFILL